MANKFILVPEEIYKGLTTQDSGEPNLDFIRQGLEKTKLKRETPSAKNVHYNQELRRYLQLRNEQQNRPVKPPFRLQILGKTTIIYGLVMICPLVRIQKRHHLITLYHLSCQTLNLQLH
ncbi:unnamed protein product [Meloidogyne enterolobii]|uniref:Uncharacterized protein n=1 Tax=Meloidogyne enterolobii TaxID=390850 RepID=A0ACB0YUZ3_MELEN